MAWSTRRSSADSGKAPVHVGLHVGGADLAHPELVLAQLDEPARPGDLPRPANVKFTSRTPHRSAQAPNSSSAPADPLASSVNSPGESSSGAGAPSSVDSRSVPPSSTSASVGRGEPLEVLHQLHSRVASLGLEEDADVDERGAAVRQRAGRGAGPGASRAVIQSSAPTRAALALIAPTVAVDPGAVPVEAVDEDGGGPEPEVRLEGGQRLLEPLRAERALHGRPDEPPVGHRLAHAPAVGQADALRELVEERVVAGGDVLHRLPDRDVEDGALAQQGVEPELHEARGLADARRRHDHAQVTLAEAAADLADEDPQRALEDRFLPDHGAGRESTSCRPRPPSWRLPSS